MGGSTERPAVETYPDPDGERSSTEQDPPSPARKEITNPKMDPMDIQKETAKLAAIDKSGKFAWRGIIFSLDRNSTATHRDNLNIKGVPMSKLVGQDKAGNMVSVWSHEVTAVEIPVQTESLADPEEEPIKEQPVKEKKTVVKPPQKKKLAPAKKGKS